MTEKLPPQWALDKAEILFEYLEFSVSYRTNRVVLAMVAQILADERERCEKIIAESFAIDPWLEGIVRGIRES